MADATNPAEPGTVTPPVLTAPPEATPPEWRGEFNNVIAQRDKLKSELRTIKDAQAKAAEAELKKRGEFEQLANARAAEVETLKAEKKAVEESAARIRQEADLKMAAKEAGIRDLEDAMRLVNAAEIKDYKTAEAAVAALKTSKPYLFADAKGPGVAVPPVGGAGGAKTKEEWLKSPIALSRLSRENPGLYKQVMDGR